MNLCGVFFNEPEGNNTYNTGFCLFWCTRGTPELKPRAIALELGTERAHALGVQSTKVALKQCSWGDWGAPSQGVPPGTPAAACLHRGSPGCHEGAEWQRCRVEAGRSVFAKGIEVGGSLGPSGGLFFPTGTQLMGVLETHRSHLPHDSTCCSSTAPLWIKCRVGPLRCTCCGLYRLTPSEGSCRKTFPKLLPKRSQSW